MKIRPVGAQLFHDGRRTDRHMTKLIAAFCNFENVPKNTKKNKTGPRSIEVPDLCFHVKYDYNLLGGFTV